MAFGLKMQTKITILQLCMWPKAIYVFSYKCSQMFCDEIFSKGNPFPCSIEYSKKLKTITPSSKIQLLFSILKKIRINSYFSTMFTEENKIASDGVIYRSWIFYTIYIYILPSTLSISLVVVIWYTCHTNSSLWSRNVGTES